MGDGCSQLALPVVLEPSECSVNSCFGQGTGRCVAAGRRTIIFMGGDTAYQSPELTGVGRGGGTADFH